MNSVLFKLEVERMIHSLVCWNISYISCYKNFRMKYFIFCGVWIQTSIPWPYVTCETHLYFPIACLLHQKGGWILTVVTSSNRWKKMKKMLTTKSPIHKKWIPEKINILFAMLNNTSLTHHLPTCLHPTVIASLN